MAAAMHSTLCALSAAIGAVRGRMQVQDAHALWIHNNVDIVFKSCLFYENAAKCLILTVGYLLYNCSRKLYRLNFVPDCVS